MTPNYSTPEFELLKQMSAKQDEMNETQNRLVERLFGDLDAENPKARFPALEDEQARQGRRISKLEIARVKLMTVGGLLGTGLGFLVEFFIHHGKL